MYAVRMTFKRTRDYEPEQARDAVLRLLETLWRNGQVVDTKYPLAETQRLLLAFMLVPDKDALLPRHHSRETRKALEELSVAGLSPPTCSLLDHLPSHDVCRCRRHPSLTVTSSFATELSPVVCGRCERRIPLYRLARKGVARRTLDGLLQWQVDYDLFYHVHLYCREGGWRAAPRHMWELISPLVVEGRRLCRQLERTLGVPVYFGLFMTDKLVKQQLRCDACPGCGRPWLVERDPDSCEGRCERCRLFGHNH